MDIFERLMADHARQRRLLERIAQAATGSGEALTLLTQLQDEIEAHQAAEEQSLYAEIVSRSKDTARVGRGVEEHDAIAHLLAKLTEADPSLDDWTSDFAVFAECLILHLNDEEAEIFPFARSLIGEECAEALASRFDDLKAVEVELWGKGVPTVSAASWSEAGPAGQHRGAWRHPFAAGARN